MTKRISILTCISVIITHLAFAQAPQQNFSISGVVKDTDNKESMEYVNIAVYNTADSSLITGRITDTDGKFLIEMRRNGKYYLSVDFIGYDKQNINDIQLNPNNPFVDLGTIELEKANIGIGEVEVVSERPFMSYKIDKKVVEVSKNPMAQGGTAADALENVPSIETDIEGNVSVRGSSDFTVLIDGRQSPLTGSDALNQIAANAIDKIEIITNPSVKYDPDGTSGIINIITKKGKLKGHTLSINTSIGNSPLLSTDINYSYRFKKATFFAGVGFRDEYREHTSITNRETVDTSDLTSSFINTTQDGKINRQKFSLEGGLDYFVSDANTFSLSLKYNESAYRRDFDSQVESLSLDEDDSYTLSSTEYAVEPKSFQLAIGDKHIFGKNTDHYISVDGFYQWIDSETDDILHNYYSDYLWANLGASEEDEQAITYESANKTRFELNYSLPITTNLIVETGYTFRMDQSNKAYNRYTLDSDEQWISNSELDDNSEFKRQINALWFLTKGEYRGIGYSIGIRAEHTDRNASTKTDSVSYNYNYLGWYRSFALTKEWKNGHQVQASYSERINRPRDYHLNTFPALSDGYTAYVPNPNLEPEYATSIEINYQKSKGRDFIAVETFYRYTENEISRLYSTISDTLLIRTITNLGNELSIGAELGGNLSFTKWWSINPVVSMYYYELEGDYDGEYTTKHSTNSRYSLTNNISIKNKTRIQLMGKYRSSSVSLDGERDGTYWIDFAIRREFFDRKLSAVFKVNDVFQTRTRSGVTISENTIIYSESIRKAPAYTLSLSYRFNQSNEKNKNGRQAESDEMESDF